MADWPYLVIKQLVGSHEFEASGAWINQKLKNRISVEQAECVLRVLKELKILELNDAKKLVVSS